MPNQCLGHGRNENQPFAPTDEPDPRETRGHLTEGRLAETRSADNIHSLAMVLAAIESANAGKRVPIPG
jgi:hypothetical protein